MSRSGNTSGGYSLVELMVALAVLGIALAVGTPYLGGYLRSRGVDAAAETLAARLDLVRHRAVSSREPYVVRFDYPEAGTYTAFADRNRNRIPDNGEPELGPHTLPSGVTFLSIQVGDMAMVEFTASGMLSPGQGGIVVLGDQHGRRAEVEIYASGSARYRR